MKNKINFTLAMIALFAVVASTIGVTVATYNLFEKQVRSDLVINAELLRDSEVFDKAYSSDGDLEVDQAQFESVTRDQLRITWIDSDGRVLFDNDTDPAKLENHKDRPEVKAALKTGQGESVRKSDTFQLNTYYYALRLDNGTVIRVSMEVRAISSVFLAALPLIVVIALAVILVCILMTRLLTRQIMAPINRMAEDMEADKDLTKQGDPEYKELIPFFNKIRSQHENILKAAKSRQDFTANVSHELKTPLTAISGYAELIENHMVEPDQEVYFASQIRANSERLLALINDIISLSELDHNQLEDNEIDRNFAREDIGRIAEEVCENLQVNAQQRGITLRLTQESVFRVVDRSLISELITNLVQNAILYNKEHGHVWVSVKAAADRAVLTVKDDGIGIPEDSVNRVFERFYRVDKSRSRERGGTGLGLALVKHIAEIHGAEIKLDSRVGAGTTITVTI